MNVKRWLRRLALMAALVLVACAGSSGGDPAKMVEQYLQAKVSGDADTVRRLLCSEMETVANREATSFSTVSEARIEGMVCRRNEGADSVTCEGEIVAAYGAENTTFPLGTYRVAQEDGEWKWCGETA